jgi:iron-sulfur cluster repair protein YtfE (RIC family)
MRRPRRIVPMSGPIGIVLSIHNAFRQDIFQIDEAAYRIARSEGDLAPVMNRLHIMDEILDYHARGEEEAVFPAVDNLTPLVAKAYLMDHHYLDSLVSRLEAMRAAPDPLITARATAALDAHLRIHLDKEDAHLYPILRGRRRRKSRPPSQGSWQGRCHPRECPH